LVLAARSWTLFPLYCSFITASLCFDLGRLAIISKWIAPQRLIQFNALNESIAIVGGIVAYALMGRIIAVAGQGRALFMAALIYLAALGVIFPLARGYIEKYSPMALTGHNKDQFSTPSPPMEESASTLLTVLFFLLGCTVLAGGVLNFTLPIQFKFRCKGDIADWGIMMAFYQIGALMAGSLLPLSRAYFSPHQLLVWTFIILAGVMTAAAQIKTIWGLCTLNFALGLGFTMVQIMLESLIQQYSPRKDIGKITSWVMMLRGAGYCVTSLIGAFLLNRYWTGLPMLIGALVLISAAMIAARSNCFHCRFVTGK
jgi:hypothetical protein